MPKARDAVGRARRGPKTFSGVILGEQPTQVKKDLKNYEKAFHYLSKANQLKFDKKGSNLEAEKKAIRNIIKIFEGIDLKNSNIEPQEKKIIFILGMPRSGTTLTEQIVASHNEVYGAGELIYLQQVLKKNFVNDSKYEKQRIIDFQNLSKNIENTFLKNTS